MLHHVIIGHGRPLIVLHGSRLDHRHMIEGLEPVFRDGDGWQRIYVDLPGHGQSPADDRIASQDDLLQRVLGFAETLLPGQAFGLIGESRGSYLAQGMMHLRSRLVRGAALIVPGGSPTSDPGRLPQHRVLDADPSLRPGLTAAELARFDSLMLVQNRDILARLRRSKLPAIELWDAAQEARVARAFDFSFQAQMEAAVFDGPSLILAGRQDSLSGYVDAIDLLPRFPRASLSVLDAAGHGLAWERPDLFQAFMRDWLQRLDLVWRAPPIV